MTKIGEQKIMVAASPTGNRAKPMKMHVTVRHPTIPSTKRYSNEQELHFMLFTLDVDHNARILGSKRISTDASHDWYSQDKLHNGSK